MNISYYTAISAMNAFQSELDVTANNMANVSTPGYKVLRSSFDDLLYTQMDTRNADQKVGHGVKTNGAETVFEQGIFEKTERDLDFAILGKAYFAVESEDEDAEEHIIQETGRFRYRPQMKETILRHGMAIMCSAVMETASSWNTRRWRAATERSSLPMSWI